MNTDSDSFPNCSYTEFPPFAAQPSSPPAGYLQDVVALSVAEVTHSNLCPHVPAIEGTRSELQPSHLQQHVGHSRQRVPLQVQLPEPLVPAKRAV